MKKNFYIDVKNGVVTCEYNNGIIFQYELLNDYKKKLGKNKTFDIFEPFLRYTLGDHYNKSSNPKFKSKAKTDKFDSFDEMIGKDIAGAKTDKKYHMFMKNNIKRLRKDIAAFDDFLKNEEDIHERKINNINDNMKREYLK